MHLKELGKDEQMNGKNNTNKSGNKWNNTKKKIKIDKTTERETFLSTKVPKTLKDCHENSC